MAASAQILKLSELHVAMVNWMISNPTCSRGQMAAYFGVTTPWLSTIIHSNAFQEELNRRQERVFNIAVARPLQERMLGAAHIALDRLSEKLSVEDKTETLIRATEMLAKATGDFKGEPAGKASTVFAQFNSYQAQPADIARAREMVGRAQNRNAIDGEISGGGTAGQLLDNLDGNPDSNLPATYASGEGRLGASSGSSAIQAEEDTRNSVYQGTEI